MTNDHNNSNEQSVASKSNSLVQTLGLLGSFSFWFVACFIIFNIFVSGLNISKYTDQEALHPLQRAKLAISFKLKEYKQLKEPPDVIVLGSSLPMSALYYSEGAKYSDKLKTKTQNENVNFFQAYTEGKFLESLLSERFGRTYSVFNFTTAACMISDVDLIWSKISTTGKKPKQVVIGLGLRDFIDNVNPKFGQTPIFKELIYSGYLANNINQFLCTDGYTVKDLTLSSIFPIWKNRAELRIFLEHSIAKQTDRVTIQEQARQKHLVKKQSKDKAIIAENVKRQKTGDDIVLQERDYQQRYNPPNMVQYKNEMASLNKLLRSLKAQGVPVTLVNMPVSRGNKKISSATVRQKYTRDLESIASKFKCNYVDFENSTEFTNKDFLDTVHLGPGGAVKFLKRFTANFTPCEVNQSVASKDEIL